MSQVTIYHNPRCSKSRQTLQLLQDRDIEPIIIEYLKSEMTLEELVGLGEALNLTPTQFMRTKESAYVELNLGAEAENHAALYDAIIEHPVLLERPIVVVGHQARIGRPPENVLEILPKNA